MDHMIEHDVARRVWVLSGPSASLVVHVDERDLLRVAHWGVRLTLEQAGSLLDERPDAWHPLEDTAEGALAFDPAGQLRYGLAGLRARFADGTRDLELAFEGGRTDDGELALGFGDRHYPLAVEVRLRAYDDSDVLEGSLVLRNGGAEEITIGRADAATWVLPRLEAYRLSQVRGRWAGETRLHRGELAYGETVLTSRRGVTSHQANPWVMIDDGTATEEHGEVYSCALAWSGSWRLSVQRLPSERVSVSAGSGHEPVEQRLAPGAELATPACAGLYSAGGFGAASRAWHRYVRGHVLPHPAELRPVLYNSWEVTGFDVDLAGQLKLAELAASLGVELYVMDDAWFGGRTHDAAGLGDWWPNPSRFPDGLGPLIDRVHALGMKFGLWVEPEMVNPDSELYRAHPDWAIHRAHRTPSQHRNQLVLDVSRPEVADWLHRTIDGLLTDNAIDFLKWDMNRSLSEAGDEVWFGHTRNLYAVLDRLRADHPGVRIESCAGGGGRIDLGILSRADQVWTSDNTDALDRLDIQHGFTQLYPAQVMAAWVTDSPNPITGRAIPLDFRFHVAMAGLLGIGGSLTEWSSAELDRARELVAVYKRIRPVVQHGELYRLRNAVQYVHDGQTVLLAFRPARHFAEDSPLVRLRGLDPGARYLDSATGRVQHGAVLMSRGVRPEFAPGDYASALIHLVRQ